VCDIGDPNDFTPRTTLYESYKQWTYDTKHKPVRSTEFYDRLEGMGLNHTRRGNGTRGFEQIRLPKEPMYRARDDSLTADPWFATDSY
jgi:hypothetical protein